MRLVALEALQEGFGKAAFLRCQRQPH
jgi:hypothetical protein